MNRFSLPQGDISRRLHGIERILTERAAAAREEARRVDDSNFVAWGASLRGKAKGYDEARDLIRALDKGRRLPQRPWGRRK